MKKYLLRIIAFAVAFAVGVGLIWSLSLFNFGDDKRAGIVFCPLSYEAKNIVEVSPNGKIEVRFKEFVTEKDELAMKFEIVNKNTEAAYYSANGYDKSVKTGDLIPSLKIDGLEKKKFICGTELEIFQLESGQTIEYNIVSQYLANDLEKENSYQVGFAFSIGGKKNFQKYWSDALPITPEIRRQMSEDLKRNRESN